MGDPIRVGLVGYGLGGSTFHAPLISATPGLQLAAIATSDPERVAKAAARYPGIPVVPRPDAFWTMRPALDLVVISTPHHTHAPIAHAALAADCHVVVDKPFATTSAEARELDAMMRTTPAIPAVPSTVNATGGRNVAAASDGTRITVATISGR